jgi:hypothetical protein
MQQKNILAIHGQMVEMLIQQDMLVLEQEHKQQVYLLVDGFHLLQMLQNYIMVQVGQQTQQLQILENMV